MVLMKMDYWLDEQQVVWQDEQPVWHPQPFFVTQVVNLPPSQFSWQQLFWLVLSSLWAQFQPVLNLETYPSTCALQVLQQLMMLSEQIRQPLVAWLAALYFQALTL
jgi:hypothetical protein